jgi:uncharacterized protein YijF (DUF1287 family)/tetratricopeptide (TPR) repeat protein
MRITRKVIKENASIRFCGSIVLAASCVVLMAGSQGCATVKGSGFAKAELGGADYSQLLKTQQRKSQFKAKETEKIGFPDMTAEQCERKGDLDLKQGSIDKAFLHYDRALRLDPENTRLRFKMARLYLRKGLTREARSELERILSKDPDNPFASVGLARVYFMEGNLAEAESNFQKALEKKSDLLEARNFVGLISDFQGNHDKAIEHYRAALSVKPKDHMSLNNLGLSYYLNGQYAEAAQAFEEALENGASNEKTHNNYALVLGAMEKYDKALDALQQGGNAAKAYNNLGVILMKKGEYHRAKEAFEQATALSPTYFVTARENLRKVSRTIDLSPVSNVQKELNLEEALPSAAPASRRKDERPKNSREKLVGDDHRSTKRKAQAKAPYHANERGIDGQTNAASSAPECSADPTAGQSGNLKTTLQETPESRVQIQDIKVLTEGSRVSVSVRTDGSIMSEVFSAGDSQVIIDLPDVESDLSDIPAVQSPIANMRVGQLNERIWVVLNLEEPVPYDVKKEDQSVTVVFNGTTDPMARRDNKTVNATGASDTSEALGAKSGHRDFDGLTLKDAIASVGNPQAKSGAVSTKFVEGARKSVTKAPLYDISYAKIPYPGGDPGWHRGSNTDLVVRALRHGGIDLQQRVHEDIGGNRKTYGIEKRNTSVDHRRVRTVSTFLRRQAKSLATDESADWQPGDIVVWDLKGGRTPSHIGIVSDRKGPEGRPLVIHHRRKVGAFTGYPSEDDVLFQWPVVGHFRWQSSDFAGTSEPATEPAQAQAGPVKLVGADIGESSIGVSMNLRGPVK